MLPSCDETIEPSTSVTLPAPDAFCRAPPSLKSVPALSRTLPVPVALTVTAGTEIVSPANRLILPLLPEAVTLSVRVRSSLASAVPSLPAATMMFPPPIAETTSMVTPPLAESIVTFPADDRTSESLSITIESDPSRVTLPAPPVVTFPLTVRALTPVVLTSIEPLVDETEIPSASVNAAPEFTSIMPVSEVTPASTCTLPLAVVSVTVPAAAAVTA